eukprot:scaffold225641_cov30-Tisochrysis_lutea.AAC.2
MSTLKSAATSPKVQTCRQSHPRDQVKLRPASQDLARLGWARRGRGGGLLMRWHPFHSEGYTRA